MGIARFANRLRSFMQIRERAETDDGAGVNIVKLNQIGFRDPSPPTELCHLVREMCLFDSRCGIILLFCDL